MNQPAHVPNDVFQSGQSLQAQYSDSRNLCARAAIYRFSIAGHNWLAWIFDQMLAALPAQARILEVGCGPGALWRQNSGRIPAGWRIVLSDSSQGMVREARAAVAGDARYRMVEMDAQRCGFGDDEFDVVLANHMLYHLKDLPRGLGEIQRVLRPEGCLLATTNGLGHGRELKELAADYLGDGSPFARPFSFSLESGEQHLRPWFGRIDRRIVRDELHVTEAEAVVNYILSVPGAPQRITGPRLADLRHQVQRQIDEKGAFIVRTEAGVFIARR